MKVYKVENIHESTDVPAALFKRTIVENYDGLPLARWIAFEQDSAHRFWGETSSGIYCARILKSGPEDFSAMENLRQEFLKLKNVFEDGIDHFVFFPVSRIAAPGNAGHERLKGLFSDFKSVRLIGYLPLHHAEGDSGLAFQDIFYIEKEKAPVENPLPQLDIAFDFPRSGKERNFSGYAALNRHEIEEFFEIGLELRKMETGWL